MTDAPSSLWFDAALLPAGWARAVRLDIAQGRIAKVATGAERTGEAHAVGLPGLPNLHSHAFQRAMAGLTESGDSFWSWRDLMYRFVDRLTPEAVEAIATLAYAEMLEAGFTRVGEFHYLHHGPDGRPYADRAEMAGRIAAAAQEAGLGLTLLPVFYAHSGFGGAAPTEGQRRFVNDLEGFAQLLEASRRAVAGTDAVVGLAPHSLRAVTPQELSALAAMGGPIHIHAAEQVKEVEDCLAWSGARPVEWLLANAPVGEDWCLVHATHMTPAETVALARSGAVAGLCPITEANLGDGLFPAPEYVNAGGRFGVGSDSNVLIDAAEELRLLEYGQRLARRDRNLLGGGAALFRGALAGGAQALGAPAGLVEGNSADIVSLDAQHPSLTGRAGDAWLDGWIFAGAAVDCVWRAGRRVVEGGRHVRREAIATRYRRALASLL